MIDLKEIKEKIEKRIEEVKENFNIETTSDFIQNGIDNISKWAGVAAIELKDYTELEGSQKRELIIEALIKITNKHISFLKFIPNFIERKIYYSIINSVVERFKRKGWDISFLI